MMKTQENIFLIFINFDERSGFFFLSLSTNRKLGFYVYDDNSLLLRKEVDARQKNVKKNLVIAWACNKLLISVDILARTNLLWVSHEKWLFLYSFLSLSLLYFQVLWHYNMYLYSSLSYHLSLSPFNNLRLIYGDTHLAFSLLSTLFHSTMYYRYTQIICMYNKHVSF